MINDLLSVIYTTKHDTFLYTRANFNMRVVPYQLPRYHDTQQEFSSLTHLIAIQFYNYIRTFTTLLIASLYFVH